MSVLTKIYLATDHAGFELKNEVKAWLVESGYKVEDCGAHEFDPEDDYPIFIRQAVEAIVADPQPSRAIIFGGSGQGEAMQANRFKGVRAAVFYGGPMEIVTLSRQHNDANVLSIGARFVDFVTAKEMVALWLATETLVDEKYHRRNKQLDK